MVKFLGAFFLLTVCKAAVFASDACTQGSEHEPSLCPLKLPRINRVLIDRNGAKSPAELDPAVTCSGFRLTEQQVRRYFLNAKSVSENDDHYTLDWSPCYASGTLFFSDGRHGIWSIDQFRRGSLVMSDGEKSLQFCPMCQFKPFMW